MDAQTEITRLLVAARSGDRPAADRIFSLVYEELRALARRQRSGRRADRTLDTTALVHEAYLKLVHRCAISAVDRRHFLAVAARAMRQITVDYSRRALAAKRGGGFAITRAAGPDAPSLRPRPGDREPADEILLVDGALGKLQGLDPTLAQLVELRFFGGFSVEEIAEVLEVSARTVKRRWRTARALLYHELHAAAGR